MSSPLPLDRTYLPFGRLTHETNCVSHILVIAPPIRFQLYILPVHRCRLDFISATIYEYTNAGASTQ